MTEFLLFTLYGPLASWGEIAMGESRHTTMYPTRSALLGILGAACGIERQDTSGQQALRNGYRFGLRVRSFGDSLRDYHTMQYGKPARNQVFRTRRDELENAKSIGTHLSARDYRTDAIAVVAAQALEDSPVSLDGLADLLRHPTFVLYLGRKSAPLAWPLDPVVVVAEDLRSAFGAREERLNTLDGLTGEHPDAFFWEEGIRSGIPESSVHWRYDQPVSRDRWQFTRRREWRSAVEVLRE